MRLTARSAAIISDSLSVVNMFGRYRLRSQSAVSGAMFVRSQNDIDVGGGGGQRYHTRPRRYGAITACRNTRQIGTPTIIIIVVIIMEEQE